MIDLDIIEDYYYGDCCEWDNGEGTNLYIIFSICEKKCIHEKNKKRHEYIIIVSKNIST